MEAVVMKMLGQDVLPVVLVGIVGVFLAALAVVALPFVFWQVARVWHSLSTVAPPLPASYEWRPASNPRPVHDLAFGLVGLALGAAAARAIVQSATTRVAQTPASPTPRMSRFRPMASAVSSEGCSPAGAPCWVTGRMGCDGDHP